MISTLPFIQDAEMHQNGLVKYKIKPTMYVPLILYKFLLSTHTDVCVRLNYEMMHRMVEALGECVICLLISFCC